MESDTFYEGFIVKLLWRLSWRKHDPYPNQKTCEVQIHALC